EFARAGLEVRLPVVDLDVRHEEVVAQTEVERQLAVDAPVVLNVRAVFGTPLADDALHQSASDGGRIAQRESRKRKAGVRSNRAGYRAAAAVGSDGRLKVEIADDVVHVENVAPPSRQTRAHLQRVRPARVRQVVEELERVQEGQQRLIRVRAQVANVAWRKLNLRHGRRRVGDVDAGDADRLRQIRACVNRSHFESDTAEADAGFIQPARVESVGVVERQALRANQTGSRAEGRPGIAVRQGRRQETMSALEAIPPEEVIVLGNVVVNLGVELIVFASQHGIVEEVVDDLPIRRFRPGDVRLWIELLDDGLRRRVE